MKDVLDTLDELGIPYQKIEHPPVFTMEEAKEHWSDLDAVFCKNLFLRDYKGKQHYLVILPIEKQLDIKQFGERFAINRPGFASEKRLEKYMKIKPGAVSPFGLINDHENHVIVKLDSALQNGRDVAFHPNVNSATVVIASEDFKKYMTWTGNDFEYLEL